MRTKILTLICTFALFSISCTKRNVPTENKSLQYQKGDLVYSFEDSCGGLFFNEKLGDDFESALNNLIASREELFSLGDRLYVHQTETHTYLRDGQKYFLILFFEKDTISGSFINLISFDGIDAIDTNGNHYYAILCDGPTEPFKPDGSYSYEECNECYLLFAGNYGLSFEEAYLNLQPKINEIKENLKIKYKDNSNYNCNDIIEKQIPITVTNCEIKDISFTMIELYMYHKASNEYVQVAYFGAIDSYGNFYEKKDAPVF